MNGDGWNRLKPDHLKRDNNGEGQSQGSGERFEGGLRFSKSQTDRLLLSPFSWNLPQNKLRVSSLQLLLVVHGLFIELKCV